KPGPALLACFFQMLGWTCQLFAVWTAMRAFGIDKPLPAAGLVLVLMNVATIFPLWPGNVGLVQAAIAIPLNSYYGVPKAVGVAFGFGLQAIEASVGVGVGLFFLAREGLSFAMLKVMPDASQAEVPGRVSAEEPDAERPRARVPG
ncbi:MAG: lysylphosphatidylglycerol synthase domain-containing protein, partial [Gaiellaceae bacterium]